MANDLRQYGDAQLRQAAQHLYKVTQDVRVNAAAMPGAGWEPLIDILERDHADLEAEIQRRQGP